MGIKVILARPGQQDRLERSRPRPLRVEWENVNNEGTGLADMKSCNWIGQKNEVEAGSKKNRTNRIGQLR
jgi:hypothetical protein